MSRRRCSGRCPGGPAQMGEDLGDHGGMLDGGDDLQVPPHWEQCSIWISNTRLSSRAQLMGAGGAGGGTSAWSAEGVSTLTGTFGMMSGRSLALRPRRAKQAPSLCLASEFLALIAGMEAKALLVDIARGGVERAQRARAAAGARSPALPRLRACEKIYCARDLASRRCSESSCISIYTPVPALRRNATSLRSRRFFHKL